MKRKLILHIGTEKTGTSSLQEFFHLNRNALKNNGIYYTWCLGEKNNRVLPSIFMEDHQFDDFYQMHGINDVDAKKEFERLKKKEFHREISSLDKSYHTVLISSEHFHSRLKTKESIVRLSEYLSCYFNNIQIVSYVREQTEMVASLYSTILKSGGCVDLNDFANRECIENNGYFNYENYLTKWESAFGHKAMSVRVFDRKELYKNDLLSDFLLTIGVSEDNFNFNIETVNESLTPLGQLLQKLVNKKFPRYLDGLGLNFKYAQMSLYISENFSGKGEVLDSILANKIKERFLVSNENVCSRYFPDKEELFRTKSNQYSDMTTTNHEAEKIINFISLCSSEGEFLSTTPDYYADLLRDSAIDFENRDMNKSYHLMKLAHEIRPSGPLIKKKLIDYSKVHFKKWE